MEKSDRSSRGQKEERMHTRRSRPVPLLFLSVLLGAASLFAWLWLVLFPFWFFLRPQSFLDELVFGNGSVLF